MAHVMSEPLPGNYITIMILHNHPFSRGSVHIASPNVEDKSIYDPKFLSHPLDLEILARHTQFVERIVATEPFKSLLKGPRFPENANDFERSGSSKGGGQRTAVYVLPPCGDVCHVTAGDGGCR